MNLGLASRLADRDKPPDTALEQALRLEDRNQALLVARGMMDDRENDKTKEEKGSIHRRNLG
jgi:hypothetical protein